MADMHNALRQPTSQWRTNVNPKRDLNVPSSFFPKRLSRIICWAMLVGPITSAQAAVQWTLSAKVIDPFLFFDIQEGGKIFGTSIVRSSANGADEFHEASASAMAEVKFGERRIGVNTTADATLRILDPITLDVTGEAIVSADLTDRFSLVARDAEGRFVNNGKMDIDLVASGRLELTGPRNANSLAHLAFEFIIGGELFEKTVDIGATGTSPVLVSVPISVELAWVSGQDLRISMSALAESNIKLSNLDGSSNAKSVVEFGNSLDWLGIRNVRDSLGNPVASFSAISPDTGVDWGAHVSPVPLPASLGFCLAGLATLVGRRRFKGNDELGRSRKL